MSRGRSAYLRSDGRRRKPATFRAAPDGSELTHQELAVLSHVVSGRSDAEIADLLGISANTLSKHMRKILAKLGADSRTEAAVKAVREGIVT